MTGTGTGKGIMTVGGSGDSGQGMQTAGAKGRDQTQSVADRLRERIISGELAAGQPLRQETIAEAYGVSRMPVREALRLLQAEGFVEMVRNRGASVAAIDARDLAEIHEMRVLAECLALRHAIPELTESRIDRAESIQGELETAPIEAFGALNKRFHMTLYEACGRPRLLAHISLLHDAADRYLRIAIRQLDYAVRSDREHRELLAACRRRDTEAAQEILRTHIEEAGKALLAALPSG
ncbi:GntR family transcriptional regulator [Stappia indica]|uniref:GntR family transcriptional regulator n=1 Tax=Stappia indica TaxID=538381 RepID=UPI001D193318|nr:GntR family transcriptional regulator [Stappia indica]MCC4245324.1 GntR family transcriptional regulator [Stappia indica]